MSDPKNYGYVMRVLVAFDQFVNVVANGNPDETISARTGRDAARGYLWARALNWALDKIQRNHTELAIQNDEKRGEEIADIEQDFQDASKPASSAADHLRK